MCSSRVSVIRLQMRRLSSRRRLSIHLLLLRRERREKRRRAVLRARAKSLPPPEQRTGLFMAAPKKALALSVPPIFTVDGEGADEFIAWINKRNAGLTKWLVTRRDRLLRGKPPRNTRVKLYSDFRMIETMSPAAALVVAAHYDRGRQLAGDAINVYDYDDWKPAVRLTLEQVGFFDVLDVPGAAIPAPSSDARTMRIARYESGDKLRQERLGLMVQQLLEYIMIADPDCLSNDERILRTAQLFDALVEATENTRRHAYPDDLHDPTIVLPNWWLTGSADPQERKLTLVVYDLGVSIPGSLASHRPSQWAGHNRVNRAIRRFMRGEFDENDPASDHAKIRLAAKYGYSSTDEEHRGKGLPVVREAIKHCRRGRLHILSRFGEYIEESGSKPISRQLEHALPGTLIVWDLWL